MIGFEEGSIIMFLISNVRLLTSCEYADENSKTNDTVSNLMFSILPLIMM